MMDDESWFSANVAVKEGFADGVLYQDQPIDVQNMKDLSFNRLSIVNSASQSIKHAMDLFQKPAINENQINNDLELAKAKLNLKTKVVQNYVEKC